MGCTENLATKKKKKQHAVVFPSLKGYMESSKAHSSLAVGAL